MKNTKIYTLIVFASLTLFSSCNKKRYTHLNKVEPQYAQTEKVHHNKVPAQVVGFSVTPIKKSIEVILEKHPLNITPKTKKNSFVILPLASAAEKSAYAKQKVSQHKTAARNDSLLWTVILILIVIWLLAFLTGGWGLGGLIYLFLVVALVILLLKLLGII